MATPVTKTSRAPRAKKMIEEAEIVVENPSRLSDFVFMEKPKAVLEIGLKTRTNVVLYGPGGYGKSDLSLEFFFDKGINPYIITMGTGLTTDRLFGGLNIPVFHEKGKIEYLVENSFMNHEFVIFEEMMDAPDFILEQLKDILSSGVFRNGTQIYEIKTRYIVCCTNKTRAEFSKNDSLKALMERFPLELNVVWENHTDISYNTLLEKRFGVGRIDPIMPFLLQEYVKNGITISPRIAIASYEIYETCGPDSLMYIAEFAKKPELITDALKKFQATIKFKEAGVEIDQLIKNLNKAKDGSEEKEEFLESYTALDKKLSQIRKLTVSDDLAVVHTNLIKVCNESLASNKNLFDHYNNGANLAASLGTPVPRAKSYSVSLTSVGSSRLETVKLIKQHTGLSLAESKELIENLPNILLTSKTKKECNSLVKDLEEIAASANIIYNY